LRESHVTNRATREYRKITIDYPLAAAKAFSTLNSSFNFVYVSGEGATSKPGMFTPHFGGIKGAAEQQLIELAAETSSLSVYNVRPGGVDPGQHPEISDALKERKAPRWEGFLLPVLLPTLRTVYPSGMSPTKQLGAFLTDLALGDGKPLAGDGVEGAGRIVTNKGFRRLAGL
jgi:hypothetical protein